jgi:hypothetical protein
VPVASSYSFWQTCRPGDQVYGGGGWVEGGDSTSPLFESAPSGDLHSWYVAVDNESTTGHTVHIYALCGPGALSYQ